MAYLITRRVVFATDFKALIIILWYVYIYTGEGNGSPLLYSCLGNPVDRGAWWAAVHGVARSRTWPKCLSSGSCTHTHTYTHTCVHSFTSLVSDSLQPHGLSPPGSSVRGISQVRILEWGCQFFLEGIFLTQGSNPCLLHCRQILYHLSHQGSSIHISMIS